ncbi:hypothetical protein V1520DRAFT_389600 [Lipomyces starkeyi]|uniref:Uncharacterized protein n=1 Tax=Lipomyces starkeyi NRRL Y-11557 TaxID=675824 RepID=A0A1E3Q8W3_LIPST|nr:hypothetical protein LIPSTDRAFT_26922 [Lipomyces starkeyi NRRL Y-11557]
MSNRSLRSPGTSHEPDNLSPRFRHEVDYYLLNDGSDEEAEPGDRLPKIPRLDSESTIDGSVDNVAGTDVLPEESATQVLEDTSVADSTSDTSKGSRPDQSFGYAHSGLRPQFLVAIECGVSEQHLGAKVDILICLKEVPYYRSPRTAYENIENARAKIEKTDQYVAEAMANNLEQDKYGPIEYRSHIWLGKLDQADGQQPVRKLIRNGLQLSSKDNWA